MSRRPEKNNALYPLHKKQIPNHNNRLQKVLFDGTSRLTDHFPRAGARFLDFTFPPLVNNLLLSTLFTHHNRSVVRGIGSFRRFLVIPDFIHIGDAVMTQSVLTALRSFFPDAHVDYVVNQAAFPIIEGNPEATRVLPFLINGPLSSLTTLKTLRDMIQAGSYDLVLNYCLLVKDKDIKLTGTRVLNVLTYAPDIVRSEGQPDEISHFI